MYISVVTLLELEMGVLSMERRDEAQGRKLRIWLEKQVIPEFSDRILSIDENIARKCAQLHVPNRASERDAFIAASALIHQMTVVSRNIKDFKDLGVKLFNPWN
jgi:toxin FitB